MQKKISELDRETGEHLDSILVSQIDRSFMALIEVDKWLTQQHFLVNAGGAVAVIGYMSSDPAPSYAIYSLVAFIIGVISSGFEIRFLLRSHKELHDDALRRRGGFVSDEMTVAEAADVQAPKPITVTINRYSGWVSQFSFIVGSIVGVAGYLWL